MIWTYDEIDAKFQTSTHLIRFLLPTQFYSTLTTHDDDGKMSEG